MENHPDLDMKYISDSKVNMKSKSKFEASKYVIGIFLVRFSKSCGAKVKTFSYYNDNESKAEALIEAKKYRNKVCAKFCFPNKTDRMFKNKIATHKTSALPIGIYKFTNRSAPIIQCSWNPKVGISKTKSFSIPKYGEEEAIQMAIDYRNERLHEIHSESETCIVHNLS